MTIDCKEGECVVSCIDREDVLHNVSPQTRKSEKDTLVNLHRHLRRPNLD